MPSDLPKMGAKHILLLFSHTHTVPDCILFYLVKVQIIELFTRSKNEFWILKFEFCVIITNLIAQKVRKKLVNPKFETRDEIW